MEVHPYNLRLTKERKRKLDQQCGSHDKASLKTNTRPRKKARTVRRKMKITDLNDDCLYEIFKDFDIIDLASVAEANKRFEFSARDVFQRKHAKDEIIVSNAPDPLTKSHLSIMLLKHFGDLIEKLIVDYNNNYRRYDRQLEKAIVEYCCRTLIEITVNDVGRHAFSNDCFTSVKKVQINGGFGASLVRKLNVIFPTASSLELVKMELASHQDTACLSQHFPSLRHLGIVGLKHIVYNYAHFVNTFTTKYLRQAIQSNPLLESLKLEHDAYSKKPIGRTSKDIDVDLVHFIDFINDHLPQLKVLDLDLSTTNLQRHLFGTIVQPHNKHKVHFKNLKNLSLAHDSALGQPYIFSEQLEKLKVMTGRHHTMSNDAREDVMELIRLNSNVQLLCIVGRGFQNIPIGRLLSNLPRLHSLGVGYPIEYETIVWILEKCKQLTTVSIHDIKANDLARLMSKFRTGSSAELPWDIAQLHYIRTVLTTFIRN